MAGTDPAMTESKPLEYLARPDLWERVYSGLPEHLIAMRHKYPGQFDGDSLRLRWPDGWHHLVDRACQSLVDTGVTCCWTQIKEKFGGLRMYFEVHAEGAPGSPTEWWLSDREVAQGVADAAELLSFRTCGLCGARGELRVIPGDSVPSIPLCRGCLQRGLSGAS